MMVLANQNRLPEINSLTADFFSDTNIQNIRLFFADFFIQSALYSNLISRKIFGGKGFFCIFAP